MGEKFGGGSAPIVGEGGLGLHSPSNTKSLGLRPTSIPSGILMHRLATIEMGRKLGRGLCRLLGRGLGPHLTQSHLGWGLPPCQVPASSIQPFGHNKHGPKIWRGRLRHLLWRGERSPHLTQSRLCQGLASYQVTSWSTQPFGCNRYGPKIGGGCAPLGEGELCPHLTQCGQGMSSFILIRPTVWPQCTNVLQTVAQKLEDFAGAKFYCLYALADSNKCIQIREKMPEFSQQCYLHHLRTICIFQYIYIKYTDTLVTDCKILWISLLNLVKYSNSKPVKLQSTCTLIMKNTKLSYGCFIVSIHKKSTYPKLPTFPNLKLLWSQLFQIHQIPETDIITYQLHLSV